MAAIKHNLQRDVFKPSEERLYAVVSVTKVGKKKKASFLCVAGMNPTLSSLFRPMFAAELSETDFQNSMLLNLNEFFSNRKEDFVG